jgi:hypothetical protein
MPTLPQRRVLIAVACAALVIGGGAYLLLGRSNLPVASASPSASPTPSPTPSPRATHTPRPSPTPSPTPVEVARCPLTGLPLDDAAKADATAILLQIENHPEARPASNLSRADMVYEAPVEGDTTRYSAVFLCQKTMGLTGPVRSARYYNVDLWQDVHLLTLGFGASAGAVARFDAAGMPYLNGISGTWPWYGRSSQRAAPHNVYGDMEAARADIAGDTLAGRVARTVPALRPPLSFDPDLEIEGYRDVDSLTIQTNSFWVFGWEWDGNLGAWRRSEAGVRHVDAATGDPVAARTVIVQRVVERVVLGDPDPGGNPRREQDLVGSGNGTVYVDGQAIDATWSRPTADDGTTWTIAETGDPLVLPPGQVWWEIVPLEASVIEG